MPIWHAKANRRIWKKPTSFGKSLTKSCLCNYWKIIQDRLLAVRPHSMIHSLPHAWILVPLETGGDYIQPTTWACILASAVLWTLPRQCRLLLLGTDQNCTKEHADTVTDHGLGPLLYLCSVESAWKSMMELLSMCPLSRLSSSVNVLPIDLTLYVFFMCLLSFWLVFKPKKFSWGHFEGQL